jgi:hypothetical protein
MSINIGASQVRQAVSTNFQDAALGSVGNQAFAGKPGATPRAPAPGIFQRIGAKVEAAIAYVKASPQQRADAQVVASARQVSADAGAMLGALTGAKGDRGGQAKAAGAIAGLLQHAAPLAEAGKSSTDRIIAPSLARHLTQLGTPDLVALRGGPLADGAARHAILGMLDPAQRGDAEALMGHVGKQLDKEIAVRATADPIAAVANVLSTATTRGAVNVGAVDTQRMDAALEQLRAGAGMLKPEGQTLRHFFAPAVERMSDGELARLAQGLSVQARDGGVSTYNALLAGSNGRGVDPAKKKEREEALGALQGAVADQIQARMERATIAASTPLQVRLMDGGAKIGAETISQLESSLRNQADALGASHTVAPGGADPATAMLARALTDLPDPQLDRLVGAASGHGLARARDGIATLADPRQTSLRTAVGLAHANQLAALSGRVESTREELAAAVAGGDRGKATMKLAQLSHETRNLRVFDNAMGNPIDAGMQADLRASVSGALTLLRAPANPDGPLTADTLRGLTTAEFGLLRKARDELGDFGLTFDSAAVRAELSTRSQPSATRAEQATARLLESLADPATSMADVVKQVRTIAGETAAALSTRTKMGQEIGADDVADMAATVTRNALAAFKANAGAGADALVDRVLARYDEHVGPLGDMLSPMRSAASDLVGTEGEPNSDAVRQTLGVINTGSLVLGTLRQDLDASAREAGREPTVARPTSIMSPDMRSAVAGEFGLQFDAAVDTARPVLSPAQRTAIDAMLTASPPDEGTHAVTLPVRGVPTVFQVDETFKKDGVERIGVSFSVSGRGPDGARVQTGAPVRPDAPEDERLAALGESMSALHAVAGDAAVPLTRYMNQQIVGGLQKSLGEMGADSPLRLPDGTALIAGGNGRMHFDVERMPDGRLSAHVNIRFSGLESGLGVPAQGDPYPVFLDAAKSHVDVQFSVFVSDDGTQFQMRDPMHMQYSLVPRT